MKIVAPAPGVAFFLAANSSATAQQWPAKPIRWIVPFPAGGTDDLVVRTVSGPMTKSLGQNFIVDRVTERASSLGGAKK